MAFPSLILLSFSRVKYMWNFDSFNVFDVEYPLEFDNSLVPSRFFRAAVPFSHTPNGVSRKRCCPLLIGIYVHKSRNGSQSKLQGPLVAAGKLHVDGRNKTYRRNKTYHQRFRAAPASLKRMTSKALLKGSRQGNLLVADPYSLSSCCVSLSFAPSTNQ